MFMITSCVGQSLIVIQYVLAVEVIVDVIEDKLEVHAAYSEVDIPSSTVRNLVSAFEYVALRLAQRGTMDINRNGMSRPSPRESHAVFENPLLPDDTLTLQYDPTVLEDLISTTSSFLNIDKHLITADSSLIALGMDSIKSVGLSRILRKHGVDLSSADIMRVETPRKMTILATAGLSMNPRSELDMQRAQAEWKEQCTVLKHHLDPDSLRLDEDDSVEVLPTTMLQAGMLTQVYATYLSRLFSCTDTV